MDRETAKDKVAKLMAMAGSSTANIHEAEAALRQATKLMTKYAIEQAELCDATGRGPIFDMTEILVPSNPRAPSRRSLTWFGVLGLAIGQLTDTIVMWKRNDKWGKCLAFSGELNDVTYAVWLAKHLRDVVRKEARWFVGSRREVETFRLAMCGRLRERMKELKDEQGADLAGEPGALVVINQKLAKVQEAFGKQSVRKGASRGAEAFASESGRAAGNRVGINRPLSNGARAMLS